MAPEIPINPPGITREAIRELIREELGALLTRADGTPYRDLGFESLFTVDVAAVAVPCSERALYVWLRRGGFEALYRWVGNQRYRMLPASQIR